MRTAEGDKVTGKRGNKGKAVKGEIRGEMSIGGGDTKGPVVHNEGMEEGEGGGEKGKDRPLKLACFSELVSLLVRSCILQVMRLSCELKSPSLPFRSCRSCRFDSSIWSCCSWVSRSCRLRARISPTALSSRTRTSPQCSTSLQ